jgi:hypothetical protein
MDFSNLDVGSAAAILAHAYVGGSREKAADWVEDLKGFGQKAVKTVGDGLTSPDVATRGAWGAGLGGLAGGAAGLFAGSRDEKRKNPWSTALSGAIGGAALGGGAAAGAPLIGDFFKGPDGSKIPAGPTPVQEGLDVVKGLPVSTGMVAPDTSKQQIVKSKDMPSGAQAFTAQNGPLAGGVAGAGAGYTYDRFVRSGENRDAMRAGLKDELHNPSSPAGNLGGTAQGGPADPAKVKRFQALQDAVQTKNRFGANGVVQKAMRQGGPWWGGPGPDNASIHTIRNNARAAMPHSTFGSSFRRVAGGGIGGAIGGAILPHLYESFGGEW